MSRVVASFLVFALFACSADTGGPRPPGGRRDAGPGGGGESTRDQCLNGIDDDRDGVSDCMEATCAWLPECGGSAVDSGPRVDGGSCGGDRYDGMNGVAPVDIIWVIDSSGSMDGEARIVQDNMNEFSRQISASGIDYHVVVITDPSFVTVPPPLGTDTMRYRFINHPVGSNEPLQALISQFPLYSDFLRPMAITHFVIVTDDESDLDAGSFQSMMEGMLGHTFDAHAIASPDETHRVCGFCPEEDGCTGPNGDAADIGRQYLNLTAATGGRFFSICTTDWSALFRELSAAIAVPMPLPCIFEIPEPEMGMTFDPMLVNLIYTPGGGGPEQTLGYVPGGFGSCGPGGGWYYDNPSAPTQIVLCPASCDVVSRDMSGSIDVALGCMTVIF